MPIARASLMITETASAAGLVGLAVIASVLTIALLSIQILTVFGY
jgi:hypothetical protein